MSRTVAGPGRLDIAVDKQQYIESALDDQAHWPGSEEQQPA